MGALNTFPPYGSAEGDAAYHSMEVLLQLQVTCSQKHFPPVKLKVRD